MLAPNFHYLLKTLITIFYPILILKFFNSSAEGEYYFTIASIIQGINSIIEIFTFVIYSCFRPIMNEENTIYVKELTSSLLSILYLSAQYRDFSIIKVVSFLITYQTFKIMWNFQSFGSSYNLFNMVVTYKKMMGLTWYENLFTMACNNIAMFFIMYINSSVYEIKAFHNSVKLGRQELALKFLALKDLENILHLIDMAYSASSKVGTILRSSLILLAFKIKSIFQPTNEEILKVLGQNHLYTNQKPNNNKIGYNSIQTIVMNRDSTYTNIEIALVMFIILINISFEYFGVGIFKDIVKHLFLGSSQYSIINTMIEDQSSIIANRKIKQK